MIDLSRQGLIDKYDTYYRAEPGKWKSTKRNAFAFDALRRHFDGDLPLPFEDIHGFKDGYLLDIGCGNGHTLEYFLLRWPDVTYTGLDLSHEACALARKRLPGHVHIHQGFLEDFNRSDSFNCVLALGVLEHIEDIPGSLMKMRDLLTHDGVLYIEVPNCIGYPYSENVEGFRELNGGSRQTEWHLFRQSWEQHFRDAGFVIIQSLTGPSITSEFVWILKKA